MLMILNRMKNKVDICLLPWSICLNDSIWMISIQNICWINAAAIQIATENRISLHSSRNGQMGLSTE